MDIIGYKIIIYKEKELMFNNIKHIKLQLVAYDSVCGVNQEEIEIYAGNTAVQNNFRIYNNRRNYARLLYKFVGCYYTF